MGYTTEFSGRVNVDPPLNPSETNYLVAFADSRRYRRVSGPYRTDTDAFTGPDTVDYNRPAIGQPELWCHWTPTRDRLGLEWDGAEKFYSADIWMQYLVDTFLRPGAALQIELAKRVRRRWYAPAFEQFSFDHVVNGSIEAAGQACDDRWALVVESNTVRRVPREVQPCTCWSTPPSDDDPW
jgi:hypothetical protein